MVLALVLSLGQSLAGSSDRTDATLCASGDGDARIAACTRLLRQSRIGTDDRASIFYDRAQAYARAGKSDSALADYSAALHLKPDFVQALNNRGSLYRSIGELDSAISDFSAVIALEPKRDGAYVNRGIANTEAGRYDHAIGDFEEAIRLAPEGASSYSGLCWAKALQGTSPKEALSDCDTALRLQPQNASARGYRALVLLRLDDFDAAIVDYDDCIAKEPQNPTFLYGRGIAKLRAGNPTGAKEDFASAQSLDPKIAESFARFGVAP